MPRFDTRLALMRAAEQLFAQQGVDRVSLREIAIAAGQRNVSAATYHFGSKRELIEAILERTAPGGWGVPELIHAVVQSPLFRNK